MFPKIGVPQNGWFIKEYPIKMDDLGIPLFSETSIYSLPVSGDEPNLKPSVHKLSAIKASRGIHPKEAYPKKKVVWKMYLLSDMASFLEISMVCGQILELQI